MRAMAIRGMLTLLIAMLGLSAIAGQRPESADQALSRAIDGPQRSAAHKARDRYRHPLKTLEFFGLQPDMTVIELWPGGGWYTEILAPALRDHGKLVEAGFAPDARLGYQKKMLANYKKKLKDNPEVYGKVELIPFDPPRLTRLGPSGSADMVLTFRNLHNWLSVNGMDSVFAAAYDVLKPGGIFGVVEHRAAKGTPLEKAFPTGYVPEAYVIAQARKAGFKLAASSEINANPKDSKDWPKGVWTLPPTLTLGDKDRDKYLKIGESDRMTLKFIKPAANE